LRGILAAVRQGIHLSACSVLPGHLCLTPTQMKRLGKKRRRELANEGEPTTDSALQTQQLE